MIARLDRLDCALRFIWVNKLIWQLLLQIMCNRGDDLENSTSATYQETRLTAWEKLIEALAYMNTDYDAPYKNKCYNCIYRIMLQDLDNLQHLYTDAWSSYGQLISKCNWATRLQLYFSCVGCNYRQECIMQVIWKWNPNSGHECNFILQTSRVSCISWNSWPTLWAITMRIAVELKLLCLLSSASRLEWLWRE